MKRTVVVLGIVLLFTSRCNADLPGPHKRQLPPDVLPPQLVVSDKKLVVTDDSPDGRVHLIVPRQFLGVAGARAVPLAPAAAGTARTIGAGIALSGAAVAAGLWLLRFRRRPVHLGKVAATAAASLLFGCGLWRNLLDPVAPTPLPVPGAICSGPMTIEFADDGDEVKVRLPRDMANKVRDDQW